VLRISFADLVCENPAKPLEMRTSMRAEMFPVSFPPELAAAAFTTRHEAAWIPMLAPAVVEWLGTHGYAVLGTELWLVSGGAINSLPMGRAGTPEVHGNTVNRERGEPWNEFVIRAAKETLSYLRSFDAADIVGPGDVYFNLVWVDQSEFEKLTQNGP
jgi:hypothetical protein